MDTESHQHRLYGDLAPWWPLISPVEDYREEAAGFVRLLRTAERPTTEILELGSGGGHCASYLASEFTMTLVDLASPMLAVSRELNPTCEHLQGDMRTIRLGRQFDAVFIHDAIDYLTTESHLRETMETARAHCRPGGVVVLAPDHTAETFESGSDHGGTDAPDGRGARYLEWSWDPDPTDTCIQTEYVFVLRHAHGAVEIVSETHTTGLFSRKVWLRQLREVGFEARARVEDADGHRPREIFVGARP
jgi:hypothetical protein